MQRFIVIRLFHSIIALVAVSMIVFCLGRLSGDPLDTLLDVDATAEDFARVRAYWGLDQPLYVQYLRYVGNILTGRFGESIRYQGQDAMELVLGRLPATLELAIIALVVSALIAIPLGVVVAVKKDTGIDLAGKLVALLGQSLPNFWLALMLMWVFFSISGLAAHVRAGYLEAPGYAGDCLGVFPGGGANAADPLFNAGGIGYRICKVGAHQGLEGAVGGLEALFTQRPDCADYLFRSDTGGGDDRFGGH